MSKLIRAGIRRYWHSRIFKLAVVATITCSLPSAIGIKYGSMDDMFVIFEFVIMAVMVSWLVGKEYEEGIFRNKVISGHKKVNIYLSELVVGLGACVILFLIYTLVIMGFALYVLEIAELKDLVLVYVGVLLTNMYYAAIFITVSCFCSYRAISLIVNVAMIFVMAFIFYETDDILREEEYMEIYDYELVVKEDSYGHIYEEFYQVEGTGRLEKNTLYLGGPLRTVLEILHNILPSGQVDSAMNIIDQWYSCYILYEEEGRKNEGKCDILNEDVEKVKENIIYALVIFVITMSIGCVFLKKKELK